MDYHRAIESRKQLFSSAPLVFLGFTFLLFPVAHISIGYGIPVYWSEAVLGVGIFLSLLHAPRRVYQKIQMLFREESPVFFSVGLFLAGIISAYFLNPHSFSGGGEIKSFYLVPIIFFVAMLIGGSTKRRIELLILSWLAGIVAAALAATTAYMFGWRAYDGRLTSLYLSPNYLAMLTAPGVLLGGYFLKSYPRDRRRWILLPLLGFVLFVLWATHSYTAWVALTVSFIVTIFFSHALSGGGFRIYMGILLFIAIVAGGVYFGERGTEKWHSLISGDTRSSLASRGMIWRAALSIARDSFPIGIGTGRFQAMYLAKQDSFPPYLEWAVPTPHNLYLHFFLEGGMATLLGFLASVCIVLGRGWRSIRGRRDPLTILGLSLIVFYLVYGVVDTPYMKNDLALAVWGSLGLSLAAFRLRG